MPSANLLFIFSCPDGLLWWLLIISGLGTVITGALLVQVSGFLVHEGKRVSVIRLQGTRSAAALQDRLADLPNQNLMMLRRNQAVDYAFMPCLYLFMLSVTVLVWRHLAAEDAAWYQALAFLRWLPLALWALDIIENTATLSVLAAHRAEGHEIKPFDAALMAVASWLKWILGAVWAVTMVSFLVNLLVMQLG